MSWVVDSINVHDRLPLTHCSSVEIPLDFATKTLYFLKSDLIPLVLRGHRIITYFTGTITSSTDMIFGRILF